MGNPELIHDVAEAQVVAKSEKLQREEALREIGVIPRCIDDRPLKNLENADLGIVPEDEFNGPQFLGGSLGIFALLAEHVVSEGRELDFSTVYTLTEQAHETVGLEIGVHMDDHHGEWSSEEVVDRIKAVEEGSLGEESVIPGCGFAGLLSHKDNPLGLSDKVHRFFTENPNVVDEFVRRGARISVLTGDHAPKSEAHAVENKIEGKTIDTAKAKEVGVQTYGHDSLVMEKALSFLPDRGEAALERNSEWLKATTHILAGMDPVELKKAA